ncbi:LOW QUALITY PROTEIN: hypothetical protein HID58_025709, partial [Brassica napus]
LKQSDASPSNMLSSYVLFANLRAVRCSNTVEVHLLRKLGKGGELMSFDMLLLDEQMIRPYLGRIENWVLPNAFDDEDKPYLSKLNTTNIKV